MLYKNQNSIIYTDNLSVHQNVFLIVIIPRKIFRPWPLIYQLDFFNGAKLIVYASPQTLNQGKSAP